LAGFNDLPNETVTVSYANQGADPLNVTITVTWLSYSRHNNQEVVQALITQR